MISEAAERRASAAARERIQAETNQSI